MSYEYHGTSDLIALPGRSVATFPSGLVRVDRTYACRANRADIARREFKVGNLLPLDDGTPAIDGLYIFPEPQETRRDDGFVEFKVSGYGRANIGGYSRKEFLQGKTEFSTVSTIATSEGATTTSNQGSITTINETLIQNFVQLAEDPFLFDIEILQNSLKIYLPDGRLLTDAYPSEYKIFGAGSFISTNSGVSTVFGGTLTSNFGRWAEITMTYNSSGFVSTVSYITQ